jgi:hypothetical protein
LIYICGVTPKRPKNKRERLNEREQKKGVRWKQHKKIKNN